MDKTQRNEKKKQEHTHKTTEVQLIIPPSFVLKNLYYRKFTIYETINNYLYCQNIWGGLQQQQQQQFYFARHIKYSTANKNKLTEAKNLLKKPQDEQININNSNDNTLNTETTASNGLDKIDMTSTINADCIQHLRTNKFLH